MIDVPNIVKEHVLKNCGRMPETQEEIDQYLDLINHGKEYAKSKMLFDAIGGAYMKKLGFKTPSEIKKEGEKLFKSFNK